MEHQREWGQGDPNCEECRGDGWTPCPPCNEAGICRKCEGAGCKRCKLTGNCLACSGSGSVDCDNCENLEDL